MTRPPTIHNGGEAAYVNDQHYTALPPSPVSMPQPRPEKSSTVKFKNTKQPPSHPPSAPSDSAAPSANVDVTGDSPRERWRRAIGKVMDNNHESHLWPLALHYFHEVAEEILGRHRDEPLPVKRWHRAIRVIIRRNMALRRIRTMKRWRGVVMKVLELSTIRRTDSQALSSPHLAYCDTLIRGSGGDNSFENCSCQAFAPNDNLLSLCVCGHSRVFHEQRKAMTVQRAQSSQKHLRRQYHQILDEFQNLTDDQEALWLESGKEAKLHEKEESWALPRKRKAEQEKVQTLIDVGGGHRTIEEPGLQITTGDDAHFKSHESIVYVYNSNSGDSKTVDKYDSRGLKRSAREDLESDTDFTLNRESSFAHSMKRPKIMDAESPIKTTRDTFSCDDSSINANKDAWAPELDEMREHVLEMEREAIEFRRKGVYDTKKIVMAPPLTAFADSEKAERSTSLGQMDKIVDQDDTQKDAHPVFPTMSADGSTRTHASGSLGISEITLQSAHIFPTEDIVAYIHQLQNQVEERDLLLKARDQEIDQLKKNAPTLHLKETYGGSDPDSRLPFIAGYAVDDGNRTRDSALGAEIDTEIDDMRRLFRFKNHPPIGHLRTQSDFNTLYPETLPISPGSIPTRFLLPQLIRSIPDFTTEYTAQRTEPILLNESSHASRGDGGFQYSADVTSGINEAASSLDGGIHDHHAQSNSSDQELQPVMEPEGSNLLPDLNHAIESDWALVQNHLPEDWKWDVEYQSGCWTCTPLDPDIPKYYPLTIAGAPVVLPVEYQWPPIGGVNPPPDPRPSAPLNCLDELPLNVIQDLFLTFEGSVGFYVLISGLLQIIVSEDFDTVWASSHLPHKYGGLRVCYIPQTLEATMLPSSAATTRTDPVLDPRSSSLSSLFKRPRTSTGSSSSTLKLNSFIEARPKANHRNEKFSGRIGLQVTKLDETFLVMSTHVITEAILARSHRDALFGRSHSRIEKFHDDWNEHVEIWAGNERIGTVEKSFDQEAEDYPIGFRHDVTLVRPTIATSLRDITSPVSDLGWLNRSSWCELRQQTSAVKILGPTETNRAAKSIQCSRPSEISIVGEGIFLNQTASTQNLKSLRDHDVSTWKNMVSRALLYRVHPDFDPPNGHSGVALYAEGTREDGTIGPGVVGFQSFVQRSGHVQNFRMEGSHLERRLNSGRVAFYGAFEVPNELKREYTIV